MVCLKYMQGKFLGSPRIQKLNGPSVALLQPIVAINNHLLRGALEAGFFESWYLLYVLKSRPWKKEHWVSDGYLKNLYIYEANNFQNAKFIAKEFAKKSPCKLAFLVNDLYLSHSA